MPSTKTAAKRTETSLSDLLYNKLKALYDVENQLVKALPKMAAHATDADLRKGFEKHLKQTEQHVERLEQAFELLGQKPQKLAGDAIRGMVADTEWIFKNVKGSAALDANLIAAAQYVEHYEIAGYETAIEWAKLENQNDAADLLQLTLDEEQETSDALSDLAAAKIDEKAMPGSED